MTSVSFFTLWRSSRLPRTTDTAPDQHRCAAVHRHPQGRLRHPQRAPQAVHTRTVRFVANARARHARTDANDTPGRCRDCTRTADVSPVSPRCGMLSPCTSPRSGRSPSTAGPSAGTAWWRSSARSSTRAGAACRRQPSSRTSGTASRPTTRPAPCRRSSPGRAGSGCPIEAAPGGYRLPADGLQIDVVDAEALLAERARTRCARATAAARPRPRPTRRAALFPTIPDLVHAGHRALLADVVDPARRGGPRARPGRRRGRGPAPLSRCGRRPTSRSVALLVRVLAAQGRDAEALEVVEQLRAELADRYGTDPSPVVAQAHLALLRGELTAGARRAAAGRGRRAARRLAPPRDRRWSAATRRRAGRDRARAGRAGDDRRDRRGRQDPAGRRGRPAAVAAGRSVRVVELAGLRAPAEVLPAVLAALGGADATAARARPGPGAAAAQPRGPAAARRARTWTGCWCWTTASTCSTPPPSSSRPARRRVAGGRRCWRRAGRRWAWSARSVHRLRALPDADALALLEARARAGRASARLGPRAGARAVPPAGQPAARPRAGRRAAAVTCRSRTCWPG